MHRGAVNAPEEHSELPEVSHQQAVALDGAAVALFVMTVSGVAG
jgi:hypothetical protein